MLLSPKQPSQMPFWYWWGLGCVLGKAPRRVTLIGVSGNDYAPAPSPPGASGRAGELAAVSNELYLPFCWGEKTAGTRQMSTGIILRTHTHLCQALRLWIGKRTLSSASVLSLLRILPETRDTRGSSDR